MEAAPAEIRVTADTRMTLAGADWYPRRIRSSGRICWFHGPRLFHGLHQGAPWCSADAVWHRPLLPIFSAAELSEDLRGGTPCPDCNAKWSMT